MVEASSAISVPGVGTVVYSMLESTDPREFGISVSIPKTGERRDLPCISPDRDAIAALLRRVETGSVTPATLADVVYDWLCE